MSISCMMHVWWNSSTSGNDRLVLLAIADEADDEGRNAYPSIRRLADKINAHTATVLRSIVRLEKSGELVIVRPQNPAPGRGNKYRIIMRPLPSPEEIRARYADDETEPAKSTTARKLRTDKLSTTARIARPNRAHSAQKLRAPMRADPIDPYIDPKDSHQNSALSKDKAIKAGHGCRPCDTTGNIEQDDGCYEQCRSCNGSGVDMSPRLAAVK